MDRKLYRAAMQDELAATPNLDIIEGEVDDLTLADGNVTGVVLLDGRTFSTEAVVLTTSTFLRGLIHCGLDSYPAGRAGEGPVLGLSNRLEALGLRLGRLKTGTPARLDATTIDFSVLTEQLGDTPPEPFSSLTAAITRPRTPVSKPRKTPRTQPIMPNNFNRSAFFSGPILSPGPRFSPPLKTRVLRSP